MARRHQALSLRGNMEHAGGYMTTQHIKDGVGQGILVAFGSMALQVSSNALNSLSQADAMNS